MAKITSLLAPALLVLTSTTVLAQWQALPNQNSPGTAYFLNPQSIKQTGPMSIYRQVQVLSQGTELQPPLLASSISLYEYDCMKAKLRVLRVSGFSQRWGEGEKLSSTWPDHDLNVWQDLPNSPLGQPALDILCPNGKDH